VLPGSRGEPEPSGANDVGRRAFLTRAAGAVVGLSGLTALTACTGGSGTEATAQPVHAAEPITLPPTTTTTLPPTTTTTLPPRLTQPLPPLIRTGPAERPYVAVTIDDVFGSGGADQLHAALDLARDRNVKLTFFPTGGAIEAHTAAGKGDVWKRVVAEGHEIGNHSYTHRGLNSLPDQEIRDELNWTQKLLTDAMGVEYKMRLMRPPGGAGGTTPTGDPRLMGILQELGYSMVMWSIDSHNTSGHDSYLAKIMGSVRNGSVVLLHFQTFGLPSLASLLTRLPAERGLTPVTVTELVAP
jgi:peptidoglycan/xylan/chitin deacetylase (PgdA/CDA1 family)